jgi:hypothetical protein
MVTATGDSLMKRLYEVSAPEKTQTPVVQPVADLFIELFQFTVSIK